MGNENPNTPPTPPVPAPTATVPPGITEEVHKAAIEKARLEERTKLYEKLTATQEQVNQLTASLKEVQTELTSTKGNLTKRENELNALQSSIKGDGTVDLKKTVSEITAQVASSLKSEYDKERAESNKRLQELEQRNSKHEAEALRARLVQEAGGEKVLIPALVHGQSETEIRASIEASKQAFEQIVGPYRGQGVNTNNGNTQQSNAQPSGNVPPNLNPGGGPGSNPGGSNPLDLENAKNMSKGDWAKNREAMLKKVRGRYLQTV